VFVTAQANPRVRFQRAIQARSVVLAEGSARELGQLDLIEALALVRLYADVSDPKYERAAIKWLRRLLDAHELTLSEARRACEWLEQLAEPYGEVAVTSLAGLVHRQ
jgi:hypothetical protein